MLNEHSASNSDSALNSITNKEISVKLNQNNSNNILLNENNDNKENETSQKQSLNTIRECNINDEILGISNIKNTISLKNDLIDNKYENIKMKIMKILVLI